MCAAAVHSVQDRHAFVVFVFSLSFYATHFAVVLFCEEINDRLPSLVGFFVVIVNELGIEDPALVHLADKKDCFCCVGDEYVKVDAFDLALSGASVHGAAK